jgi:aminomethyltransferase
MVSFAGWNMPVQYRDGILAEHKHTREKVSLFDICHMGEFRVKGKGAEAALDGILARTVRNRKPGVCGYNFILTPEGTVMDDLIVYRISEDEFFIVVNAGTKDSDAAHFREKLPASCEFFDESETTAKIDIQGPLSADVLLRNGFPAETLPGYFKFIETEINSVPCILSRTGYTGELGFEIYVETGKAVALWNLFLEHEDVKPAGLGARDTLRLEMGYALYGHELDLNTTPVEAGYGPMLKLKSPRKFIGGDALKNSVPSKRLVALKLEGRRAAREGAEIEIDGHPAGKVTSGAFAPSLGYAVAMAYIRDGFDFNPGTAVSVVAGRKKLEALITELPFYREGSVRKKL